tara:strand:+ start:25 stop:393 length:369 start_codon:yes stop_codon:yes gene_type:complete
MKSRKIIRQYNNYIKKKTKFNIDSLQFIVFGEDEFKLDIKNNLLVFPDVGSANFDFGGKQPTDIEFVVLERFQGNYRVGMFQHKSPYGAGSPLKNIDGEISAIPYKCLKENYDFGLGLNDIL